jgi:PAS domain S-box-containing protein
MGAAELVGVRNIFLSYGSVRALTNVTMAVKTAEIHAIVGEHGAGKSSLAHVLGGFQKPDAGTVVLGGRSYSHLTTDNARRNGIQVITQHNPLVEDFTVADNILINGRIGFLPNVIRARSIQKARDFIESLNVPLDPTCPVRDLNRADRALVDIVKHLYPDPQLLILDETLENLAIEVRQKVVAILNARKARGMSVLFITHRIDDIYNFGDRITIIRDGEILTSDSVENIDKIMLIRLAYTHALAGRHIQSDRDFANILKYNEAILFDLPINLVVVDKENRIKLVNALAKELFGLRDDGYSDMSLRDIFPAGNEKCLGLIQDATELKRQTSHYQVPLRLRGEETLNTVTVYPIFDGSHFIGSIIIISDMTNQERLRQQVVLSENLASIGLLAAGVAHEINNPLDIMGYYLENIRFNAENAAVRSSVKALEEEIASIAQIVGNLLTFSGKKGGALEEFNIVALITDLVGLIAYNAKRNGIVLALDAPGESIVVEANRNEMKQVILNLVKNGFEAMPEGGTLAIGVGRKEVAGAECCSIDLEDTGCGIDDAALKDIFLPFFSTKNSTGRNAGLGLSICYGIVTKYGGTISVVNRENGGCRFAITLPIVR